MATEKPITTETVALTEKKVDMALDDIIKMSKNNTNANKGKKQRAWNKKDNFNGAAKNIMAKAQRYMDSRYDVRQGAFAHRRSNFQGNQFPVATSFARKAASGTPLRGRPFNAGRMTNTNQSRFISSADENRFAHRRFATKQQHQQQQHQHHQQVKVEQKQGNGGGQRQWPQTLDSRFANMKEERMRRFTHQRSNAGNNPLGGQQRPMLPWARRATRFPN